MACSTSGTIVLKLGNCTHPKEVPMKFLKACSIILTVLFMLTALGGCESGGQDQTADQVLGSGSKVLRILSGSENSELEPILEQFANENDMRIEMTYPGSLDIMRQLEQDKLPYDAVWPASSLWLNVGDSPLNLKHAESISITPVIFGIRQSLAEQLGFVGREVSVGDLLEPIRSGQLRFCMTSATQSNSGASAYIGFLYAMLGNPESITLEDLQTDALRTQMTELLAGVERSSGSSDWLKDMFLEGDFDAMVNYECLIIQANQALEAEGREPLYAVYPTDGLTIADSPLAYVDQGDGQKEELFLSLQEYLLSDAVQSQIQRTGRRSSYTGVNPENRDVFREDWGLQPDRVLSPIHMPAADVLFEALDLYQTQFKKPSLNVYCLDYSGSMSGDGNRQLEAAMEQLLIQSYAAENFLQASENEVNIIIPFNDETLGVYTAEGNGPALEDLYATIEALGPGGGTDMYQAAVQGIDALKPYDLSAYTPAIILLTDGQSGGSFSQLADAYASLGSQVPIFSIMFGDADESQLEDLAEFSNARVFDGREDLVGAFRSVKGYN